MRIRRNVRLFSCSGLLLLLSLAITTDTRGAPAHSAGPGCLVSEGNVIFGDNATLVTRIGGLTPCAEHTRFEAGLTMTVAGARMAVSLIGPFTPAAGDRFQILSFGMLEGTGFSAIDFSEAPLPPYLEWDSSSLLVNGELAVVELSSATVPLPRWSMAVLTVLLARATSRTRRRSASAGL